MGHLQQSNISQVTNAINTDIYGEGNYRLLQNGLIISFPRIIISIPRNTISFPRTTISIPRNIIGFTYFLPFAIKLPLQFKVAAYFVGTNLIRRNPT